MHTINGHYTTTLTKIGDLNDTTITPNEPVDISRISSSNSIRVTDYFGQYMDMSTTNNRDFVFVAGSGYTNLADAQLTWYEDEDSIQFVEERFQGTYTDTSIFEGRKD